MRPLLLLFLSLALLRLPAQPHELRSPDGRLRALIQTDGQLRYALEYDGRPLVSPSPIALRLADGRVLGRDAKPPKAQRREIRDTLAVPLPYKRARVIDHGNELLLQFREGYALVCRAYDDGFAWRWRTAYKDSVVVEAEEAAFRFAAADSAWLPVADRMRHRGDGLDAFHTSFEELYQVLPLAGLPDTLLAFTPALLRSPGGPKVLITDADLDDYPGLWLAPGPGGLEARFAPYPLREEVRGQGFPQLMVTERAPYIARCAGTRDYPWRLLVVAPRDADLLATDIVWRLGGPLEIPWPDWLRPGKSQSEWVIDNNLYGVDFRTGLNTETYRYYIDYEAHFGMEYVMFDAGWSEVANPLNINPDMDVKGLIRYARSKGVSACVWTSSLAIGRNMDQILDSLKAWGAAGFMVDFMDRDDQKTVRFYRQVAEAAARRQLFVNFHGAFKGAGMERRFPNAITREGLVAFEFNKWTNVVTPEYEVTVPFIRMVAGPVDYEPGTMRNAQPDAFRIVDRIPMTQGTRVHQLAMYIVYESPYSKIAASPSDAYREPEYARFMASLPTVWEETGVLDARLSDYVLLWRRARDGSYYLGAMGDGQAYDLVADLSFLPEGEYELLICRDGINADRHGEDYRFETRSVRSGERLSLHLAPGGGWVARARKKG